MGFWTGLGKVFGFLIAKPIRAVFSVLGWFFTGKIKFKLSLFFAIIILINASVDAIGEKDVSVLLRDGGGSILGADYNLEKRVTEHPLTLSLEGKTFWDALFDIGKFLWNNLSAFSLVWFIFAWLFLFKWIAHQSDNTKPALNWLYAVVMYVAFVLLTTVYFVKSGYYSDWRYPWEGLMLFFEQLLGVAPELSHLNVSEVI